MQLVGPARRVAAAPKRRGGCGCVGFVPVLRQTLVSKSALKKSDCEVEGERSDVNPAGHQLRNTSLLTFVTWIATEEEEELETPPWPGPARWRSSTEPTDDPDPSIQGKQSLAKP